MTSGDSNLIGRDIVCLVNEPWNFRSDAGPNRLTGVVRAIYEDLYDSQIAVETNPFVMDGERVTRLLCKARYAGENIALLLAGDARISCNLYFSSLAFRDEVAEVRKRNTACSSTNWPYLIGTIELAR